LLQRDAELHYGSPNATATAATVRTEAMLNNFYVAMLTICSCKAETGITAVVLVGSEFNEIQLIH
jgi:hypothetical protein